MFLSYLFVGIEREYLLLSELCGVIGMKEVLFLNNMLCNLEAMLGDLGLSKLRVISSRDFPDVSELICIHCVIEVLLSNTIEIIEAAKTCERTNMGLMRDDGVKRRGETSLSRNTLMLQFKHRDDVMGDAVAVRLMTR